MGIYIKGETPTSCEDCPMAFAVNFGILCTPTKRIVGDGEISKKQGFCPLIPVPPHGRLIDADALFETMERTGWYDNADRDIAEDIVLGAPTVIPASEKEE